ncbi:hypothetical protein IFM89_029549 [Coptis chinensis]|uniref:Pectinesterase catalytic domain-containing protein n=1 Tax=Coptis chinensis TaxID=261450 RepID=A0A835H3C4_9MAGN|nr:hypothetical protein IFM89_029549 [Coptis chinensis]
MQGYQDTLDYHTCHQFYKNCEISSTVDFIFGEGRALIQDNHIILRVPNPNQKNTIIADGRSNDNMHTGLVIQHYNIFAEAEFFPNGLKIPMRARKRVPRGREIVTVSLDFGERRNES